MRMLEGPPGVAAGLPQVSNRRGQDRSHTIVYDPASKVKLFLICYLSQPIGRCEYQEAQLLGPPGRLAARAALITSALLPSQSRRKFCLYNFFKRNH